MKILAIETATEACSAALSIGDSCIHRFEIAPRQHTQLILPMVDELLLEADIQIEELDAIAFGQGPGTFTGVRIAIGVVQGLAFAHDIPVLPISTLAALAQHSANEYDCVAASIDARMQEIYWGLYKKDTSGVMQPILEEKVCAATECPIPSEGNWFGIGTGWNTYPKELESRFKSNLLGFNGDILPTAVDVMTLAKADYKKGNAVSVEAAMPVYLRNKVANKSINIK